jgi:poly(3-hydroxybutyrate) depolymerase
MSLKLQMNAIALGITISGLIAACGDLDSARTYLNAFDYKGDIRVSVRNAVPGKDNQLFLVASTPKTVTSLVFCLGNEPDKCVQGANGYTESRRMEVDRPRHFFVFNNVLEVGAGSNIAIVGKDANGQIVDRRVIEFATPNGGTTASPGPSPSGNADGRNSNGSGGPTGQQEVEFRDAAGLRSTYKITVPADATSKVYGLHVHLHGDGGGGYRDYPNRETRNDLIGVTVLSPNRGQSWNGAAGPQHARYLNELIQNDLIKKYNINLDRIYFSGVSGGAYFLSGYFIPTFGAQYNSGAFLMCGGMAPQQQFANPEFLKTFRIHWETTNGERQDILANVRQSIAGYQNQLRQVGGSAEIQTSTFEGAGGHCIFDGRTYTSGIQFMMDRKFNSILKN